jgi:hypothetical protein
LQLTPEQEQHFGDDLYEWLGKELAKLVGPSPDPKVVALMPPELRELFANGGMIPVDTIGTIAESPWLN